MSGPVRDDDIAALSAEIEGYINTAVLGLGGIGSMPAYCDLQEIANGSDHDIQPVGSDSAIVYSVMYEDDIEIYWVHGATELLFDAHAGAGVQSWAGGILVNNGFFLRVKNVGGEANHIGHSGRYIAYNPP